MKTNQLQWFASLGFTVGALFIGELALGQSPPCTVEGTQLLTGTPITVGSERFGLSVSVLLDKALVCDPLANSPLNNAGAAYTFGFDGTAWTHEQTLLASDAAASDQFGSSTSMDGDIAVIGAPNDAHGGAGGAGSAYVFRFNGASWVQEAKLTAGDFQASDNFGFSIDVSGNTIVAGARGDDDVGLNAGAAYVFEYDGVDWNQEQKLFASDGAARHMFGSSVAIDGDTVAIGAPVETGFSISPGSAYVFARQGTAWEQQQKLAPTDGANGDRFGTAIAIEGNTVVTGAPLNNPPGTAFGAAYAYLRANDVWSLQQKLIAATLASGGNRFGTSVALERNSIVVGAPFVNAAIVVPVIGASTTPEAGSAFLFQFDGAQWTLDHQMFVKPLGWESGDASAFEHLGRSVAISGGVALVGTDTSDFGGKARFFDVQPPDCDANGVPDPCDPDCNHNYVPDVCDLASGTSNDCDGGGVPDECDAGFAYSFDYPLLGSVLWGAPSFSPGFDMLWLNQFNVTTGGSNLTHIAMAWAPSLEQTVEEGAPCTLLVYDDPNNDANPSDAVLLATAPGHVAWPTGGDGGPTFVIYPIKPTFVGEPGESFFVGAVMTLQPNQFVALAHQAPPSTQSWIMSWEQGQANLNDLSTSIDGPEMAPGRFRVRAVALDCNGNGAWDQCDIESGASLDSDGDGIPDECEGPCVADVDGNSVVDIGDLLAVIGEWGPCVPGPGRCAADISPAGGDGVVNVGDLLMVIGEWGACE